MSPVVVDRFLTKSFRGKRLRLKRVRAARPRSGVLRTPFGARPARLAALISIKKQQLPSYRLGHKPAAAQERNVKINVLYGSDGRFEISGVDLNAFKCVKVGFKCVKARQAMRNA